MVNEVRAANEAWEALLQSQVLLMRSFTSDDVWGELSANEYDVLYALSKCENGMRIGDLNKRTLLTQAGISRLVARLDEEGYIARASDPEDSRATRIVLTDRGVAAQKDVGRRHARAVSQMMNGALDPEELTQLQSLCTRLIATAKSSPSTKERNVVNN